MSTNSELVWEDGIHNGAGGATYKDPEGGIHTIRLNYNSVDNDIIFMDVISNFWGDKKEAWVSFTQEQARALHDRLGSMIHDITPPPPDVDEQPHLTELDHLDESLDKIND